MEYRDRATSLMKQKDEMNVSYLKNRGTIKTKIIEDSKISEEEEKGDKRTLVKVQKPQQILMNDEMEEREYSNYNDPSLMDSPQSMRSVISMNERKHLDFNIKKMIELIENCCSNPLKQVECMVELFKGVDFILNHEGFWPEIFKCDLNDRHSRLKLVSIISYI